MNLQNTPSSELAHISRLLIEAEELIDDEDLEGVGVSVAYLRGIVDAYLVKADASAEVPTSSTSSFASVEVPTEFLSSFASVEVPTSSTSSFGSDVGTPKGLARWMLEQANLVKGLRQRLEALEGASLPKKVAVLRRRVEAVECACSEARGHDEAQAKLLARLGALEGLVSRRCDLREEAQLRIYERLSELEDKVDGFNEGETEDVLTDLAVLGARVANLEARQ